MTTTLLLIPGLGNTERLFEHQIATFQPLMKVIVADHTRDDSVEAIAGRTLADAPERFALAGLSMGGYVAMEIMRQAPERVEKLALLDTSARPDTEESKANRERLIGLAESARFDEIVAETWPKFVHSQRHGDEALKAVVAKMLHDTGAAGYIRQQRANHGPSGFAAAASGHRNPDPDPGGRRRCDHPAGDRPGNGRNDRMGVADHNPRRRASLSPSKNPIRSPPRCGSGWSASEKLSARMAHCETMLHISDILLSCIEVTAWLDFSQQD